MFERQSYSNTTKSQEVSLAAAAGGFPDGMKEAKCRMNEKSMIYAVCFAFFAAGSGAVRDALLPIIPSRIPAA